ncbi:hypothetical protein [Sulfobacillus thermosulfidooxidans]|uniref:hypothetical protein n=1 Tax=Sulfobacillus thermosulfidooxidans TaxID=28034 RepID=UPI000979FCEB|nr:hypothetical protein [Sulfobacillus thermosulfidooxidans]OLZ09597.1 hypothetical protein BFX05_11585 [Sulfobacillus thermosulfidooxidans]OLZ16097.1 hypothetical protein BFX06_03455 [Sulfobacillus thermosulfidooxidans]OLZ18055.1 hypothetical protein BFX07_06675 [Sulfobacillus thermosulfidooxidans]
MTAPLLPIQQRSLTRQETADLLRGLSDFVETYPDNEFIVSIDIMPQSNQPSRTKTKRNTRKSV